MMKKHKEPMAVWEKSVCAVCCCCSALLACMAVEFAARFFNAANPGVWLTERRSETLARIARARLYGADFAGTDDFPFPGRWIEHDVPAGLVRFWVPVALRRHAWYESDGTNVWFGSGTRIDGTGFFK